VSETLHSTDESGEPIPTGPGGGKAAFVGMRPIDGATRGVPNPLPVPLRLERIADLARQLPEASIHTISRHFDIELLRQAFEELREDGATGIDGVTVGDYGERLDENLGSLVNRVKSGTYRAPPVKRAFIPKPDGTKRPIGIPTLEDKLLQRAVLKLLNAIYEQDFLDCSYGFRPNRGCHDALSRVWRGVMKERCYWLVEVDIRSFFDSLDKDILRELLRKRINDGIILDLIDKWLDAGVSTDEKLSYPEHGTPQGGVISPLLANVYLHYVLDLWFTNIVLRHIKGRAFLVRYADDFVLGFERETDARDFYEVLPKRFRKHGLELHPDKTRLIDFRPPERRNDDDNELPTSFDFLAFTHVWGRSRKGNATVRQFTAKGRFKRALGRVGDWLAKNFHESIEFQHRRLCQKLRGHYGYFGITGNMKRVSLYKEAVQRLWYRFLAKRSQLGMTWKTFAKIRDRFPLTPPYLPLSVFSR
jgi:RNA-directed DNA polymerase